MSMVVRGWAAAAGVVAVLATVAAAGAPERAAAAPAEYRTLLTAAQETLANRAIALVEGATPASGAPLAAGNVARAPSFAAAETAALHALATRRDDLRTAGESYAAAETKVGYLGARQVGDRLELTVAERTSLYLAQPQAGEPAATSVAAKRTFVFTRDGGRWVLLAQTLTGGGPAPLTEPDSGSAGGDMLTPLGGVARVA
jgi:hypothetical protein